jgi:hypothetical protein
MGVGSRIYDLPCNNFVLTKYGKFAIFELDDIQKAQTTRSGRGFAAAWGLACR